MDIICDWDALSPTVEELRREWQRQEDHPLTEPCPRCGTMHNHAVNIDWVIAEGARHLADVVDQQIADRVYADLEAHAQRLQVMESRGFWARLDVLIQWLHNNLTAKQIVRGFWARLRWLVRG